MSNYDKNKIGSTSNRVSEAATSSWVPPPPPTSSTSSKVETQKQYKNIYGKSMIATTTDVPSAKQHKQKQKQQKQQPNIYSNMDKIYLHPPNIQVDQYLSTVLPGMRSNSSSSPPYSRTIRTNNAPDVTQQVHAFRKSGNETVQPAPRRRSRTRGHRYHSQDHIYKCDSSLWEENGGRKTEEISSSIDFNLMPPMTEGSQLKRSLAVEPTLSSSESSLLGNYMSDSSLNGSNVSLDSNLLESCEGFADLLRPMGIEDQEESADEPNNDHSVSSLQLDPSMNNVFMTLDDVSAIPDRPLKRARSVQSNISGISSVNSILEDTIHQTISRQQNMFAQLHAQDTTPCYNVEGQRMSPPHAYVKIKKGASFRSADLSLHVIRRNYLSIEVNIDWGDRLISLPTHVADSNDLSNDDSVICDGESIHSQDDSVINNKQDVRLLPIESIQVMCRCFAVTGGIMRKDEKLDEATPVDLQTVVDKTRIRTALVPEKISSSLKGKSILFPRILFPLSSYQRRSAKTYEKTGNATHYMFGVFIEAVVANHSEPIRIGGSLVSRVIVSADIESMKMEVASRPNSRNNEAQYWRYGSIADPLGNTVLGAWFSGHVGVGVMQDSVPLCALEVSGDMMVMGQLTQPSDERIKQHFRLMDGQQQLENIKALELFQYDMSPEWLEARGLLPRSEVGVIAQKLSNILPDAVGTLGDVTLPSGEVLIDVKTVKRDRVFMEGMGAIGALGRIVDTLTARTHALEEICFDVRKTNNDLIRRIQHLEEHSNISKVSNIALLLAGIFISLVAAIFISR